MSNSNLPSNLRSTLLDLESTLLEWEKNEEISSEDKPIEIETSHEKELQKKAKELFYRLKSQIDDLS